MEPRPFVYQNSGSEVGLLMDWKELNLTNPPAYVSVTLEFQFRDQTIRERYGLNWASLKDNRLPLKSRKDSNLRYRISLLNRDRFLLAIADGSLSESEASKPANYPLQFRLATAEERFWEQEFRIFVIEEGTEQDPDAEPDLFSFKDVRDIFFRHNCVVCHGHEDGLDLRRFPFIYKGQAVALSSPLMTRILEQIDKGLMPPQGLSKVSAMERGRLHTWHQEGYRKDALSPLLKGPKSFFQGAVILRYSVVDSSQPPGEILLSARPHEFSFMTRLKQMPREAEMDLDLILKDNQGRIILEKVLGRFVLGQDPLKAVRISVPSSPGS